jgi:homoserine/homoserine lactone efflux protein
MSYQLWLGFLVAVIVIALSPGPSAVTCMSSGLRHGVLRSLPAVAGLQAALIIQLGIVAAGLGAVIAASATAFFLLKLAGAAYLIWLGIQRWRAAATPPVDPDAASDPSAPDHQGWALFTQGLLVNLTNPKAIVFIAALVPQFIDPHAPQLPQFLIIGLTMCGIDSVVMTGYATLAARCRQWLSRPDWMRWQNRFFGTLFITAGALLARSQQT